MASASCRMGKVGQTDLVCSMCIGEKEQGVFLCPEKHERIVVKMIWHELDMLHTKESFTEQYASLLNGKVKFSIRGV